MFQNQLLGAVPKTEFSQVGTDVLRIPFSGSTSSSIIDCGLKQIFFSIATERN